ncbi:hypothetical protein ELS19_02465 [Halogeometricum borinquense]|uniref:Uncharacterized protein n=2 Tax=Halogeometricum borinquense TaxID=60847 RepID=A0A482T8G4_9EURY|nr:hypothetical protein [Halogeometricum borinquense]RYJ12942.1 hypothetical protein ELS19_02465 [Halogeometricum borinquense]
MGNGYGRGETVSTGRASPGGPFSGDVVTRVSALTGFDSEPSSDSSAGTTKETLNPSNTVTDSEAPDSTLRRAVRETDRHSGYVTLSSHRDRGAVIEGGTISTEQPTRAADRV